VIVREWREGILSGMASVLIVAGAIFLLWVVPITFMGPEPGEREAQLRADSVLLAAELTVARATIDTLQTWIQEANARFREACDLLPVMDFDSCVTVVESRLARQAKGQR